MITGKVLDAALRDLFDFSPVPLSISTTEHDSRYVKVNPAYLDLIGYPLTDLRGRPLGADLPYSMDDPARLQRMHLLETQGFYELAEIDMQHADGRIIPTLISAQRRRIGGESLDIEVILDNSGRKAFERAILEAALTDPLTGLPNRRSFNERLRAVLAGAPEDRCVALAYIDLNGFKAVNDRHGHAAGDELLRIVAERLRAAAGTDDFIARLGGDEFAVIFAAGRNRAPDEKRLRDIAARIVGKVRVNGATVSVGAAIGVSVASAGASPDTLLDHADALMYAAKSGRRAIDIRIAPLAERHRPASRAV